MRWNESLTFTSATCRCFPENEDGGVMNKPITGNLALASRQCVQIENYYDSSAPAPGVAALIEFFKSSYPDAQPRTTEASAHYNCHGLTFASRRTGISSSAEIIKILREDGYQEVATNKVMPGDVLVWFSSSNDAIHSGLVVESGAYGNHKVVSKWGGAIEFVHFANNSPYQSETNIIKYYRLWT